MSDLVLELIDVTKVYGALRPLRIANLQVTAGERVAIVGVDRPGAEVFVNLVTGAALPDSGVIHVFGRQTSAITDSTEWLAVVDRFGIVTNRAVLLDGLTVVQNLALPFSLDLETLPADARGRAAALAREVGLPHDLDARKVADLDGGARARVRLGRALALGPAVLLLEHPTESMKSCEGEMFGTQVRRLAATRGASVVALTADLRFAHSVAERVLAWDPASGRLTARRKGWFSG